MFSENYTVSDKHSLVRAEYVSSLDRMPWLYTSLYDSQYLPVLDEAVSSKLNLFFRYRFPFDTDEPLVNARKILQIEHNEGDIKLFDCRNEIKYSVLSSNEVVWKHFTHSLECQDLNLCRQKIDKMTSETDIMVTKLFGIQYNPDASFRSVSIYDDSYDLEEYSHIDFLSKLNDFCRQNSENIKGVTTVYTNSNKIDFRLTFNYAKRFNRLTRRVEYFTNLLRERYLQMLVDNGLLTFEQLTYINSLTSPNSRIDLEFVFDDQYNLEEVFLYNYRIYEFEDLTTA